MTIITMTIRNVPRSLCVRFSGVRLKSAFQGDSTWKTRVLEKNYARKNEVWLDMNDTKNLVEMIKFLFKLNRNLISPTKPLGND